MLAFDGAYRLTTLGLPAFYVGDVHAQHIQARMLGPGDVLFAVSHTGSTFETLAAVRAARAAAAMIVAVTSFARSPLTELCDHAIVAGSAETRIRVEAVTSRLVHLPVLDALHTLIRQRIPTPASTCGLPPTCWPNTASDPPPTTRNRYSSNAQECGVHLGERMLLV